MSDPFLFDPFLFGTTQTSVTLYTRTSVTLLQIIEWFVLKSRFVVGALSPPLRVGRSRRDAAKRQGRSEAED